MHHPADGHHVRSAEPRAGRRPAGLGGPELTLAFPSTGRQTSRSPGSGASVTTGANATSATTEPAIHAHISSSDLSRGPAVPACRAAGIQPSQHRAPSARLHRSNDLLPELTWCILVILRPPFRSTLVLPDERGAVHPSSPFFGTPTVEGDRFGPNPSIRGGRLIANSNGSSAVRRVTRSTYARGTPDERTRSDDGWTEDGHGTESTRWIASAP